MENGKPPKHDYVRHGCSLVCKTGLGQKPIGKTRGPLMANTIGLNSELSFISLRHFICAPQLTHSDPHLRCLRDVLGMPWDVCFFILIATSLGYYPQCDY